MGRPPVEPEYLGELVTRLPAARAVYLTGSAALGGYERGRSDLDVIVAVDAPLSGAARARTALAAGPHHRGGRAARGRMTLGAVPRELVLAAMADAVAWHARHEPGEGAVLAAARAWHYAETGAFASKAQALDFVCRSR